MSSESVWLVLDLAYDRLVPAFGRNGWTGLMVWGSFDGVAFGREKEGEDGKE
jgi:hypothetical protein